MDTYTQMQDTLERAERLNLRETVSVLRNLIEAYEEQNFSDADEKDAKEITADVDKVASVHDQIERKWYF